MATKQPQGFTRHTRPAANDEQEVPALLLTQAQVNVLASNSRTRLTTAQEATFRNGERVTLTSIQAAAILKPVHSHFDNHVDQLAAILTLIEDEGARDAAWKSLGGRPSERKESAADAFKINSNQVETLNSTDDTTLTPEQQAAFEAGQSVRLRSEQRAALHLKE
jgi:hypothetical protein